ncbi:uncharacterized protein LOC131255132 [Magnolia sinica]|uniref:uncharacterized protein LOC131255132 n=1 Tax=Magnolia sinica TaxID=86752 RepID=UPI00265AC937|nr:uncharacterized protein LOC131255132 [Magnolia sinica]
MRPKSWLNRMLLMSLGIPESSPPAICLDVVKCGRPDSQWVKLNVDGSALNNPGSCGGGGICRREDGNMIFAFSSGYGQGSNNSAEFFSIYKGLSICVRLGLRQVLVESDSKMVVDLINGVSQGGWKWSHWLARIATLTNLGSFHFSHIL